MTLGNFLLLAPAIVPGIDQNGLSTLSPLTDLWKADVISQCVEGPITSMVPASALQLHQRVKVIIDDAAASKLSNIDYYKEVYANRP